MLSLVSPAEVARELAQRARRLRLELGWNQVELARRAGVALSTLRHFERTGQISLERLVRIASALHALKAFEALLQPAPASTLEELEGRQRLRKRGRRVKR